VDLKSLEAELQDVNEDNFLSVVKADELRTWKGIILHHSYHPDKPVWKKNYGRSLNNYHKFAHNYSNGLGYQFVVTWNPRNPETPIRIQCSYRWVHQLVGAHTTARKTARINVDSTPNECMIGLCIVGNFDIFPVPPELYTQLKVFTNALMSKLRIPRDAVYGHYQFDYKTCPGKKMDIPFFRR